MTRSQEIFDTLQRMLTGISLETKYSSLQSSPEPSVYIDLPDARNSDYSFTIWLEPEMQIHARLSKDDFNNCGFWYRAFEAAEFRNPDDLGNAFMEMLKLLLSHETRIIQKHGLLFENFRCEYLSATGWKRVDANGYFRLGGFIVPVIEGRRRIYSCPALLPHLI
jgi:hypothetical protein